MKLANVTFVVLEDDSFILNQALLTRDDLLLFLELHGYDYDNKRRSRLEFSRLANLAINDLLNDLGADTFIESVKWFNSHEKAGIRQEIVKRKLLLDSLNND